MDENVEMGVAYYPPTSSVPLQLMGPAEGFAGQVPMKLRFGSLEVAVTMTEAALHALIAHRELILTGATGPTGPVAVNGSDDNEYQERVDEWASANRRAN